MNFQLPANLQVELLAYDPTLKQLARTTNAKTKSNKPKFPLGQPYGFVPEDAIKTSLIQNAIDLINAEPVERRYHEFSRITGFGTDAKSSIVGILYHYESVWYAAWLPPKGKEQDYVYGFAFAYKDTKTSRNMLPYELKRIQDTQLIPHGRSNFITYSRVVTKQDIVDGYDRHMFSIPQLAWKKGGQMREVVKRFSNSLADTIPTWNDSRHGIFGRIKHSNYVKLLEIERYIQECDWNTWKPSVDNVFEIIDGLKGGPHDYNWGYYKPIRHIIDKPFFRKWIQAKCDEVVLRLSDTENQSEMIVKHPWNQITTLFDAIGYVNRVWLDCPVDYYQTHINNLLAIYNPRWQFEGNRVSNWLNEHMPVASYFHIVDKHVTQGPELTRTYRMTSTISSSTGLTQYYFTEWKDTLQMLHKVLCDREEKNIETLPPPKRWRLTEFHDYVQAEAWKVENTNHKLPQDLFPEPIKVSLNDQAWTFIQPIDTHQLAAWGQAVRNCVGDAASYADGVRKKKHFIVLAMLDNKPTFTIQLEVDRGMMSVKQIVGTANARLTGDQQDSYTKAFAQALKLQESKLQST
tara:strand:+ start:96 stop:1820 length:1725 start_codon:yes stop_codon:yes gene_type:complete